MKEIMTSVIEKTIEELFIKSCYDLDSKTFDELIKAKDMEKISLAKNLLSQIIENASIAKINSIPICQDTGICVVYLEIGNNVHISGNLDNAINNGIRNAYSNGYLRKSVVLHPLNRINTNDNTPAIIHTKIVDGDSLKIKVVPKGAGSENMSQIKMLNPSVGLKGVKNFVLQAIIEADGRPCPPLVIGIGIGGDFEKCAMLSKEALLRDIDDTSSDEIAANLEKELKEEINKLNIGPMGLGGKTTCLAVKVNCYPCHIASLPVAVNIGCHANRHYEVIL